MASRCRRRRQDLVDDSGVALGVYGAQQGLKSGHFGQGRLFGLPLGLLGLSFGLLGLSLSFLGL